MKTPVLDVEKILRESEKKEDPPPKTHWKPYVILGVIFGALFSLLGVFYSEEVSQRINVYYAALVWAATGMTVCLMYQSEHQNEFPSLWTSTRQAALLGVCIAVSFLTVETAFYLTGIAP